MATNKNAVWPFKRNQSFSLSFRFHQVSAVEKYEVWDTFLLWAFLLDTIQKFTKLLEKILHPFYIFHAQLYNLFLSQICTLLLYRRNLYRKKRKGKETCIHITHVRLPAFQNFHFHNKLQLNMNFLWKKSFQF